MQTLGGLRANLGIQLEAVPRLEVGNGAAALGRWSDTAKPPVSPLPSKNRWERDPIPYALETDWPVGVAGFEPLHLEIRSAEVHPRLNGI